MPLIFAYLFVCLFVSLFIVFYESCVVPYGLFCDLLSSSLKYVSKVDPCHCVRLCFFLLESIPLYEYTTI